MTFIWPEMLLFLFLIPLLCGLYILLLRRRRQFANRYSSLGLNIVEKAHQPGFRRHIPPMLFLIALSILLISLARPQMTVSLPKLEGTIILAFDVSGSMAADDFKPNRIDVIKTYVRDFVEHQPATVQIGVVAFSDNGFSVLQPTNNKEEILASVNRLKPQRGTSLGNGILASLKTISTDTSQDPPNSASPPVQAVPGSTPLPEGKFTSAMIVLLSDGENNENPDPLDAAKNAADQGVRIHTVGIGNPAGTILHVNGFTVRTRLNEKLLQDISSITSGKYYKAGEAADLQKIFDDLDPQLVIKPEKMEVTSLFSGASILIFLAGAVVSFLWFNRLP